MLQALNTGHDGGLSTAHGNSCRDILSRLEMMVLMGMDLPLAAIRQQIASGIQVIVHLGRLSDKSRRVLEIAELDGIEDGEIRLHALYQLEPGDDGWRLEAKGSMRNTKRSSQMGGVNGLSEVPADRVGAGKVRRAGDGAVGRHSVPVL